MAPSSTVHPLRASENPSPVPNYMAALVSDFRRMRGKVAQYVRMHLPRHKQGRKMHPLQIKAL